MMCGGTGAVKPADREVQEICDSVKGQVEEKTGKKYEMFLAKSYTSQVVAGMNYFVKVQVGENDDDHVHVRILKELQHKGGELKVHGIQEAKSHNDPIGHF